MHFDDILKQYLGEFGRYQKIQYILVCLPTIFTALHALSWTFTGAKINHRCRYPGEDPYNATYASTDPGWILDINALIAKRYPDLNNDTKKIIQSCYRIPGKEFNSTVALGDIPGNQSHFIKCSDGMSESYYVWDNKGKDLSAVMYWELVCDQHAIRPTIQAMYYIGQFIGSLILGPLSDKIGRKKVFFIAIMIQIVCGTIMAYVPWWPLFALLRVGVGFAHPGIFLIAVVIGMELVGPSRRMLGGIASGLFFAAGQILLGALAYGIRDYRNYQLAISLPALIFISYWWLVPESARWLLSQRRFHEADEILQRAARINKRTLPPNWYEQLEADKSNQPSKRETKKGFKGIWEAYCSLFRTPNIRRRSLLTFICWPAVSMSFYGLAMNPSMMGGVNELGFIIGGLLEFPSLFVVLFTINILGRKFLCMAGFLLAAICLIAAMAVQWKASEYDTLLLILVVLGKSALTGVYAVLYIFTPELFPTTIRNTAMGACSMIARVGAVAASYVSMYLADVNKAASCAIFAVLCLLAGLACIGLPETAGHQLFETIEDAENFGKNLPMFKFMDRRNRRGGETGKKKEEEAQEELLMKPQAPATPPDSKKPIPNISISSPTEENISKAAVA